MRWPFITILGQGITNQPVTTQAFRACQATVEYLNKVLEADVDRSLTTGFYLSESMESTLGFYEVFGRANALEALLAGEIIEADPEYPQIRPYLTYLLGLAYELQGDEANAVRAYWQLWHNFPESSYTPLARAKLW